MPIDSKNVKKKNGFRIVFSGPLRNSGSLVGIALNPHTVTPSQPGSLHLLMVTLNSLHPSLGGIWNMRGKPLVRQIWGTKVAGQREGKKTIYIYQ